MKRTKLLYYMPLPIPKALFGTLETIGGESLPCVLDYMQSLQQAYCLTEYKLTRQFLQSYAGSLDTYTAYRREVERLLHWTWLIAKTSIQSLDRNQLREYLEFAQKPPQTWIATQNHHRFILQAGEMIHNRQWRPFVVRVSKAQHRDGIAPQKNNYRLSHKSMQALFAGLSTYFTYLQQEDYRDSNPILLIRQKGRFIQKEQRRKVTRKLSPLQWRYVINITQQLANQDVANERLLFMLAAFYLLGLRISELAETPGRYPKMGDFAPDKQGLWWFTTVGKGNKLRDIAVPDELMLILKRYRQSQGLTPLPARGEDTPLLHKQRGPGGLGTRQIRNLVQQCFNQAENQLRQQNKMDEAEDLRAATVHWLRHTAISADIEFRPREHVRDDAGHEDPATTERYIDTDRTARHHSAKSKKLHPDAE